jgi:hypothetical protein
MVEAKPRPISEPFALTSGQMRVNMFSDRHLANGADGADGRGSMLNPRVDYVTVRGKRPDEMARLFTMPGSQSMKEPFGLSNGSPRYLQRGTTAGYDMRRRMAGREASRGC